MKNRIRLLVNYNLLVYLLLGLILHTPNAYCQKSKADSLLNLVNTTEGKVKFDYLIDLVREIVSKDIRKAFTYAQQARELAVKQGDTVRWVTASRIVGQLYNMMAKPEEAKDVLLKVLPMAEKLNLILERKKILLNLALAYNNTANYDESLRTNFKALELYTNNYDLELASISSNIGISYLKLGDYKKALSYFLRSLRIKQQINDYHDMERTFINTSLSYACIDDFKLAKTYLDSASIICKGKGNCSVQIEIEWNFCSGIIHFGLKQFDLAVQNFRRSYYLANQIEDHRFVLDNIDYLVKIYNDSNQYEVVKYLKEAEVIIDRGTPFNLEAIKIYSHFIDLYNVEKDFEKMAYYQNKYIELKDSIYNENLTTNLMKVESDYLQRENIARIKAQGQVIDLTEKNIAVQRLVNILIGIVAFALLIVIMLLIRINKTRKTINEALEKKVQERTYQLALNRDSWLQAYKEKEASLEKVTTEVRSTIATIVGLNRLVQKEIHDPRILDYTIQSDHASKSLLDRIRAFN
ncbi:tetratricopeptide repeat protein [Chryseosolibacter indicus]|uniref:Tetratricopeptide repeat protein n=1 Tax=Chryseosolibacter indicus TaxID=2782351 RepID=A0ABS5VWV9_9BACT|nr:tetratricopeptide repeat protein [Chryseosolibacter indicus]MBT1705322.1 tetratricopeptide repeat protein [Chryseosolibacter indicus]